MAKWSFHRPTTQPQESSLDSNKAKAKYGIPGRKSSPSGRWKFHLPDQVNTPEGHGWHFDETAQVRKKNRVALGERWTCDYGCKSFVWSHLPEPGQYHAYDCPYWQNEGSNLTPF